MLIKYTKFYYRLKLLTFYLILCLINKKKSLLQLIQENQTGISQAICKNLLFQLCKAIEKCHSLNIIHRGNQ